MEPSIRFALPDYSEVYKLSHCGKIAVLAKCAPAPIQWLVGNTLRRKGAYDPCQKRRSLLL